MLKTKSTLPDDKNNTNIKLDFILDFLRKKKYEKKLNQNLQDQHHPVDSFSTIIQEDSYRVSNRPLSQSGQDGLPLFYHNDRKGQYKKLPKSLATRQIWNGITNAGVMGSNAEIKGSINPYFFEKLKKCLDSPTSEQSLEQKNYAILFNNKNVAGYPTTMLTFLGSRPLSGTAPSSFPVRDHPLQRDENKTANLENEKNSYPRKEFGVDFSGVSKDPKRYKENNAYLKRKDWNILLRTRKNKESFAKIYETQGALSKNNVERFNLEFAHENSYTKLAEVQVMSVGIAAPERIRQWAEKTIPNGKIFGEVLNANTLHHKTFKPIKGGLFCERIFGPLKDFECSCGKTQRPKQTHKTTTSHTSLAEVKEGVAGSSSGLPAYHNAEKESKFGSKEVFPTSATQINLEQKDLNKNITYKPLIQPKIYCPVCDVEYTWSVLRRYQLGYIQLASPVTHIWYVKGSPNYISLLLGMKKRDLDNVIYCSQFLSLEFHLKDAFLNSNKSFFNNSSNYWNAYYSLFPKNSFLKIDSKNNSFLQYGQKIAKDLDQANKKSGIFDKRKMDFQKRLNYKNQKLSAGPFPPIQGPRNATVPYPLLPMTLPWKVHASSKIIGVGRENMLSRSDNRSKLILPKKTKAAKTYLQKFTFLLKKFFYILNLMYAKKNRPRNLLHGLHLEKRISNILSNKNKKKEENIAQIHTLQYLKGTHQISFSVAKNNTILGTTAYSTPGSTRGVLKLKETLPTPLSAFLKILLIGKLNIRKQLYVKSSKKAWKMFYTEMVMLNKTYAPLIPTRSDTPKGFTYSEGNRGKSFLPGNLWEPRQADSNAKRHPKGVGLFRSKAWEKFLNLRFSGTVQRFASVTPLKRLLSLTTLAIYIVNTIHISDTFNFEATRRKFNQLNYSHLLQKSKNFYTNQIGIFKSANILKPSSSIPTGASTKFKHLVKDSFKKFMGEIFLFNQFLFFKSINFSLVKIYNSLIPTAALFPATGNQANKIPTMLTSQHILGNNNREDSLGARFGAFKNVKKSLKHSKLKNKYYMTENKMGNLFNTISDELVNLMLKNLIFFSNIYRFADGNPPSENKIMQSKSPHTGQLNLKRLWVKLYILLNQQKRKSYFDYCGYAQIPLQSQAPSPSLSGRITPNFKLNNIKIERFLVRAIKKNRLDSPSINPLQNNVRYEVAQTIKQYKHVTPILLNLMVSIAFPPSVGASREPGLNRKNFRSEFLKQNNNLILYLVNKTLISRFENVASSPVHLAFPRSHYLKPDLRSTKSLKNLLGVTTLKSIKKITETSYSHAFPDKTTVTPLLKRRVPDFADFPMVRRFAGETKSSPGFPHGKMGSHLQRDREVRTSHYGVSNNPAKKLLTSDVSSFAKALRGKLLKLQQTQMIFDRKQSEFLLRAKSSTLNSTNQLELGNLSRSLVSPFRFLPHAFPTRLVGESMRSTNQPSDTRKEFAYSEGKRGNLGAKQIQPYNFHASQVHTFRYVKGPVTGNLKKAQHPTNSRKTIHHRMDVTDFWHKKENVWPNKIKNIPGMSYKHLWLNDRDWRFFMTYYSGEFNYSDVEIPIYATSQPVLSYKLHREKERKANSLVFNVDQQLLDSNQRFRGVKRGLRKHETLNISSSYTGAGIIQKILQALNSNELNKIAMHYRILLYDTKKAINIVEKLLFIQGFEKKLKRLFKKRRILINHYQFIRRFTRKNIRAELMVLTTLPVLPPDLRPIIKMGNQIAASDLNRLYQRVIYRNERLRAFLKQPAITSSYEISFAQKLLQEAVDNLIQNGKGRGAAEMDSRGRALKSLTEILKGKEGRFRQYLLGKRVDYSGRSVIVVGPKLKLHECGIPKEMALELYLPFLLKRILKLNLTRTVVGAKTLLKTNKPLVWQLLREIMRECPVLLNRAPTLHRLGFQAFQPKLVEGRAILLHPLVCPSFNADFDGDQMAVHVPITTEARAEAWKFMLSRNNLLSPATGEPILLPSQDMVLGCYYLTTNCNQKTILSQRGSSVYFSNFEDVLKAYYQQKIDIHAFVWVKWHGFVESPHNSEQPIEIRVNLYGNYQEIYSKFHRTLDSNGLFLGQYICTTPGRILFNNLVQNLNP